MATYTINYTDINTNPIIIDQGDLNVTSTDVALFGRINLEYGALLNENLLHLLEKFSCPEASGNPGNPDLTVALSNTLSNPPIGQLWYNSTQQVPFVYDGTSWDALGSSSDFAANSGKIYHNQQLPLPVSSSGYQFSYAECIWIVTPSGIQQAQLGASGFNYMVCTTTSEGLVDHQYSTGATNALIPAIANYVIIGMRNSNSVSNPNPHMHNYDQLPPPPPPVVTPSVTPAVTSTPAPGVTVTITPTPHVTPSVTITLSPTSTIPPTSTPIPTITPSLSITAPITGILYVDPSVGLSQTFGSSSSSLTACTTSPVSTCVKSLGIWLANLSGGTGGPYTITWNLSYFYSVLYNNNGTFITAPPALNIGLYPWTGSTYNGTIAGYSCNINGIVSNVNGGTGLNTNAYCTINYLSQQIPAGTATLSANIAIIAGSSVTISDTQGNSTTYYVPAGSYGQVLGTQLTTAPVNNYSDGYQITYGNT